MLFSEFGRRVAFLTVMTLAAPMSALANHGIPTDRLVIDATELLERVRMVGLRYDVVASVERLVYESRELDRCVDLNGRTYAEPEHEREHGPGYGHPGHGNPGYGHPGSGSPSYPSPSYPAPTYPQPGSRYCSYELSGVQQAFREVESYLYDTQYDRPQVYRLYLQVRQDVDTVVSALLNSGSPYPGNPYPGNPYPGQPYPGNPYPPAPAPLRAVGAIDTLNFSFIGDRFQIERQCLDLAARVNARWIQTVTVNGRRYQEPYGRWMGVQEACSIVARQAQ